MPNTRTHKLAALLFGSLFLYTVALVFRQGSLFFMCTVLALLPFLSYGLARLSLRAVTCERWVPERLTEGEEAEVRWQIRNRSWLPRFLIQVQDRLPEWLEVVPGSQAHCLIPMLRGNEPLEHRYRVRATLRGQHRIGPMELAALDAFDLFPARTVGAEATATLIYPATVPLREAAGPEGGRDGRPARQRATVSPAGLDFYSTREYQPGDDLRRIHWRTTARWGKLSVLEFEQSGSSQWTLVLDVDPRVQAGRGRESTLEYEVKLAASVARAQLERGQAVGLVAWGREAIDLPLASGADRLTPMLEALALVQADGECSLAEALARNLDRFPAGSIAVILSPATDPALLEALADLRTRSVGLACYCLLADSFRSAPDPRPADPETTAATAAFVATLAELGARVYPVRQGDDLRSLQEVGRTHG